MHYTSRYQSPLGEILLAADNIGLTGLWFYGQKYFALHLDESHEEKTCPVLGQAKIWLDLYFSVQILLERYAYSEIVGTFILI